MLNITIFPILKQQNENGIVLFSGNHIKTRIKNQKSKLFLMKLGEICNKKVKHMRNGCQLQCKSDRKMWKDRTADLKHTFQGTILQNRLHALR